jgi:hypothetical protein
LAVNRAELNEHRFNLAKAMGTPYVFISYRHADREAANAVATFLLDHVDHDVYCSERDANLKQAIETGSDEQLVACIEHGLWPATHFLGIISKNTAGSWWVPFEFGIARHKSLPIALMLLDDVAELPSYMKLPTVAVIRDRIELRDWAEKLSVLSGIHLRSKSGGIPDIPRLALVRRPIVKYR